MKRSIPLVASPRSFAQDGAHPCSRGRVDSTAGGDNGTRFTSTSSDRQTRPIPRAREARVLLGLGQEGPCENARRQTSPSSDGTSPYRATSLAAPPKTVLHTPRPRPRSLGSIAPRRVGSPHLLRRRRCPRHRRER